MKRPALILAIAAGLTPMGAPPAAATVAIGKQARDLGYVAAANCAYCHTFDSNHSVREARRLGLRVTLDCIACHGARLPKRGPALLNPRGLWMAAEKQRLKAPRVDAAWLKDYREPSPSPPASRKPANSSL